MFKETIKYTDFNGDEREEDFYFNLTRAEFMRLDTRYQDGLQGMIEKIIKSKVRKDIWDMFELLIGASYGIKSEDGRRFMKSDEITKSFTETEAYSELIDLFSRDADAASRFVNNLVSGIDSKVSEARKNNIPAPDFNRH